MKKIQYLIFSLIFIIGTAGYLAQAQDIDEIAPATVTDLSVSSTTQSSVTLSWTAPGDDGLAGTANSYDVRYATTSITNDNWENSTISVPNESVPQAASSKETLTISGLMSSTLYYFALKTKDEAGNESYLSNVVSTTTLAVSQTETTTITTFQMNFTPETLNLKSQGKWVTVHLFLPAPYKASDVDLSSILLNGKLKPDLKFKGLNRFLKGMDDKGSNASNLVLKFSRSEFIDLVGGITGKYNVTLTGKTKGEDFITTDTVRIVDFTPEPDGTLIMATSSPEVYIIANGKKRHIPSPASFLRHGYKWENIKKVSLEILNSYSDDELLKTSDNPAVYLIIAGMKRHIPSAEVFESYGFNWDDISIVSRDDLADYTNVSLIRQAGDAKVYLLVGGKKHWISSAVTFNDKGYKWENIIIVNAGELNAIPSGEDIE